MSPYRLSCGMFHSLDCFLMTRLNVCVSLGGTPTLMYVALALLGMCTSQLPLRITREALDTEPLCGSNLRSLGKVGLAGRCCLTPSWGTEPSGLAAPGWNGAPPFLLALSPHLMLPGCENVCVSLLITLIGFFPLVPIFSSLYFQEIICYLVPAPGNVFPDWPEILFAFHGQDSESWARTLLFPEYPFPHESYVMNMSWLQILLWYKL